MILGPACTVATEPVAELSGKYLNINQVCLLGCVRTAVCCVVRCEVEAVLASLCRQCCVTNCLYDPLFGLC